MDNKIYLHVGMPKTATTYMQNNFERAFNSSSIEYIGVYQPREQFQHEIYNQIMQYVSKSWPVSQHVLLNIRRELSLVLKSKSVLLSEEMMLITSSKVTWKEKLRRLAELVDGFETVVIVTTRYPVDIVYSLYVEFYRRHHDKYPDLMSFVEDSNNDYIQPIHYSKLDSVLKEIFGTIEIEYLSYEEFCANSVHFTKRLSDILCVEVSFESTEKLNVKKSKSDGYYSDPIKLSTMITSFFSMLGLTKSIRYFLSRSKLMQILRIKYHNILGSVSVSKGVKVPFPTDDQKEKIELIFKEDINFLEDQSHKLRP